MAIIDEVLSILANSKNVLELPTATATPQATDWLIFWNVSAARVEKIKMTQVSGFPNWLWIDDAWVAKAVGNTDIENLEANDVVYFKPITNSGDPLTLLGYTYDGGNDQLEASYTQNQAIVT